MSPPDASYPDFLKMLPHGAIAPKGGPDSDLETCVERGYGRLLALVGDRPEATSTAHRQTRTLLLGLLCVPLYQQRGLLPTDLGGDKDLPLARLLANANSQYGLAFPVTALPSLSGKSGPVLWAMLHEMQACQPYPVARLGQLYERCLAWQTPVATSPRLTPRLTPHLTLDGRKAQGTYYTPGPLVDYCVEQTLGRLLNPTLHPEQAAVSLYHPPRILDPAAGGGAFLLAAYDFLLHWATQQHPKRSPSSGTTVPNRTQQPPIAPPDWATRLHLLRHCIHGVDLDAEAIALTRLALQLKLLEGAVPLGSFRLPDLRQNLVCAESLLALDWEATFPPAAQSGGFDIVLGNPPYIDAAQMSAADPDWRRACTQRYRCASGNWDLFCVFIERALELCRAGGLTSLVVPNKLRSAGYAATARSHLTQTSQLLALRDYTQVSVFRASVYPLVYVARKQGKKEGGEEGEREREGEKIGLASIDRGAAEETMPVPYDQMASLTVVRQRQMLYAKQETWWLADSQAAGKLIMRLQQQFPSLGRVARVRGAATVAEAYALKGLICDNPTPATADLRLVNSGTIDRYQLRWGDRHLRYLGDRHLHPTIPATSLDQLPSQRQQQARQPKLIVAGMTQRLECALDETGGVLAGKSTSVIQPSMPETSPDWLWLLLAILNSTLIHWYFVQCFGGNALQGGYLRVGPPQLRQIPAALAGWSDDRPTLYQTLITLAQQMQRSQPTANPAAIAQLDRQIDAAVYELYRLSPAEISEVDSSAS
ncbi:MAG: hypothetical protein Fur0046_32770 [Cyanobacteria bacterium J069]|nr:MAG: hypothetical protein D6742_20115 [Cyanobacteria bacterium J069]